MLIKEESAPKHRITLNNPVINGYIGMSSSPELITWEMNMTGGFFFERLTGQAINYMREYQPSVMTVYELIQILRLRF